ncbi:MAG: response regulator [Planctomycetota bacterium]
MIAPNLLITDDDSAFRSVLCEALSRRGFQVTQAADGQEALDLLERTTVHLALVDVHMPRVTGLQVIREVTARPDGPPCVLMSAQLDDQIRREAEQIGAFRVLSKPFRMPFLSEVVRKALSETYGW